MWKVSYVVSIVEDEFQIKSASLYDKYVQAQQKPLITLDNYQVHYSVILERMPIFYPYEKNTQEYYQNRFIYAKKAGFIC